LLAEPRILAGKVEPRQRFASTLDLSCWCIYKLIVKESGGGRAQPHNTMRPRVLTSAADAPRDAVSGKAMTFRVPVAARAPTLQEEELLEAIQDDDAEAVARCIVTRGADPNISDYIHNRGARPVHVAALGRKWKALGALLRSGGIADKGDSRGRTPLHALVRQGDEHAVRRLVKVCNDEGQAFDLNRPVLGTGMTALHLAVHTGNTELVMFLVQLQVVGQPFDDASPLLPQLWHLAEASTVGLDKLHDVLWDVWTARGCLPPDVSTLAQEEDPALKTWGVDAPVLDQERLFPPESCVSSTVITGAVRRAVEAEAQQRTTGLLVAGDAIGMPRRGEEMGGGPRSGNDDVATQLMGQRWNEIDRELIASALLDTPDAEEQKHSAEPDRGFEDRELWREAAAAAEAADAAEEEADGASVCAEPAGSPRIDKVTASDVMREVNVGGGVWGRAQLDFTRKRPVADVPLVSPPRTRAPRPAWLLPPADFIDAKTVVGETPLLVACRMGFSPIAFLLIAAGANALERTMGGRTALGLSGSHGHTALAAALIEHCGSSLFRWENSAGSTTLQTIAGEAESSAAVTLLTLEDTLRDKAAVREKQRQTLAQHRAEEAAKAEAIAKAARRKEKKRQAEDRQTEKDLAYLARCRRLHKEEAADRKRELQELAKIRAQASRREREAARERAAKRILDKTI
jgi:ankyrin repeat protein